MNAIRRQFNWPAAVLLVILCGVVGYSTNAYRSEMLAPPTAVATVNLERVFQGLTEQQERVGQVVKVAEELDDLAAAKRDEIDLLREDLALYPPGSEQYENTAMEIGKLTYKLQAFIDFGVRKLDADKARTFRDSYEHIKTSAEKLAQSLGYNMVVVDDSIVAVPPGTEAETMRQISARRILYADPQVDITDRLITQLNEDYEARRAQGG